MAREGCQPRWLGNRHQQQRILSTDSHEVGSFNKKMFSDQRQCWYNPIEIENLMPDKILTWHLRTVLSLSLLLFAERMMVLSENEVLTCARCQYCPAPKCFGTGKYYFQAAAASQGAI